MVQLGGIGPLFGHWGGFGELGLLCPVIRPPIWLFIAESNALLSPSGIWEFVNFLTFSEPGIWYGVLLIS